jgi:hypothetical protein
MNKFYHSRVLNLDSIQRHETITTLNKAVTLNLTFLP